jgi:hypothetical protein
MNISNLKDQELHSQTLEASIKEKKACLNLLKYLLEIDRRKLYAEYNHPSLLCYMIGELKYSEGESWTRIQAMRLMRSNPIVEEKILSGELSLTNAALAQKQIKIMNPKDSKKIIEMSLNVSNRKLKETFDELNYGKVTEKKITLNESLLKKIKKIKESWGEFSELEIIESLLDEKIMELNTSTSSKRRTEDSKLTRYISKNVKNEIFIRSEHRCEHFEKNGKRCSERRNLEYDHIRPFALNGDRSRENIRLICRAHNQRRAIKTFGVRDYNVLKNCFE